MRFARGLNRVSHQIDQHLLELIGIDHELSRRTGKHLHGQAGLKGSDPLNNWGKLRHAQDGWRHLGELAVGLQETIEGMGPGFDDREPSFEVLALIRFERTI